MDATGTIETEVGMTPTRDLRGYEPAEMNAGSRGKILGAVAVAVLVAAGAAGFYAYQLGTPNALPLQKVASADLPSPAFPPVLSQQPTAVPPTAPSEPVVAPVAPEAAAAPKVRTARTHVAAPAPVETPAPATTAPAQPAQDIAPPAIAPVQDAPQK